MDLSAFQDQNELYRLKNILFPKQEKVGKNDFKVSQTIVSKTNPTSHPQNIKTQIDKLRSEISNVLSKKISKNIGDYPAEKLYLDGINKMTKSLYNNTNQIRQVFDDFLEHLPTQISQQNYNYQNNYFLSMCIQNSIWNKIQHICNRPLIQAFGQIRQESIRKRSLMKQLNEIEKNKKQKNKNKIFINTLKYFNVWRYKNCCMSTTEISDNYLKQNSLENDKRIIKNIMNLPYLVMMLEQYGKQSSDVSELILVQQNFKKCCKYVEENHSYINTSLETVTHRSLLYTERDQIKFKRYQFQLMKSLTKNCIQKGEIMFISNLSKHPEFSQIDNICMEKICQTNNNEFLKGSAVFYPLFNDQNKCIGVLRTFFFQNSQKVLPGKKIQKISLLLELGLNVDYKMKNMFIQKEYQTQGYYLKFINIIKMLERSQGHIDDIMKLLSSELSSRLNIKKTSIYRITSRQSNSRDPILQNLYGGSEQHSFLLSLIDQIIKQESNYIYLQNRLIIYSKMMLFDLEMNDKIKGDFTPRYQKELQQKLLPIDLIVKVMIKAQNIIVEKQQKYKTAILNQKKKVQHQQMEVIHRIRSMVADSSVVFLGKINHSRSGFYQSIAEFIKQISELLPNSLQSSKQYKIPQLYLECSFSENKKDQIVVNLLKNEQISGDFKLNWSQSSRNMLKVKISNIIILLINLNKSIYDKVQDILLKTIQKIIQQFLNAQIQNTPKDEGLNYIKILQSFYKSNPISQIANCNKKLWQLKQITRIYESFQQIIQSFASHEFGINEKICWQNEKPQEKNLEQWKQVIYALILCQPEQLGIDIVNNNYLLSMQSYKHLSALTSFNFSQIVKESWLIISNSKSNNKVKYSSSYGSLILKIPMYFVKPAQVNSDNNKIMQKLDQIKLLFRKLSYTLIDGISNVNQNLKQNSIIKLTQFCKKSLQSQLRQGITCIKLQSNHKQRNINNFIDFTKPINDYVDRLNIIAFNKISIYSHHLKMKKIEKIHDYSSVNTFSTVISKIIYHSYMEKIKNKAKNRQSLMKFGQTASKIWNRLRFEALQSSYQHIYYYSKRSSKILIFNEIIKRIVKNKYFKHYHQIKNHYESSYYYMKHDKEEYHNIQKCSSLIALKKQLYHFTPDFRVYLAYDQQFCYTLYSPKDQKACAQVQNVYNPPDSFISYQTGTKGQLIWNYRLNEGESCFKLKDRLSHISKYVEISISKCKQQLSLQLIKLSMFKRNWLRTMKTKVLKKWKNQSHLLFMNEKNRLNDSLYQLSIESQTMKQKLKGQQKLLKYNLMHYQEEQKKQEEYQDMISMDQTNINQIVECQFKLENTKNIYQTLNKRSIMKSCVLLWKNNAALVKLNATKKKRLSFQPYFKIGLKSVGQILQSKYQIQIKSSFFKILTFKKVNHTKSIQLQKIAVMFQDSSARLITFHSDQQNYRKRDNSKENIALKDYNFNIDNSRQHIKRSSVQKVQLTEEQYEKNRNGTYKLNPKTLKFLKRMGKLQN